ncbi:hypothetical protein FKM82_020831 [Ascaphus truei]
MKHPNVCTSNTTSTLLMMPRGNYLRGWVLPNVSPSCLALNHPSKENSFTSIKARLWHHSPPGYLSGPTTVTRPFGIYHPNR